MPYEVSEEEGAQEALNANALRVLSAAIGSNQMPKDVFRRYFAVESAIDRIQTNATGLGQRFAIAPMEVRSRVLVGGNGVKSLSAGSPRSIESLAKSGRTSTLSPRPREMHPTTTPYMSTGRWEASFSHMTRGATEAGSRPTAELISSHVAPERRYGAPPRKRPPTRKPPSHEEAPCRPLLPAAAGRYYQLLQTVITSCSRGVQR